MTAKHEPTDITRAQVKALSAFLPQEMVAKYMKMTRKTLMKYYSVEVYESSLDKDLQVVSCLYENAVNGNVSAQIFWCKTRLGMSESKPEETIENGAIGKIEISIAKGPKND